MKHQNIIAGAAALVFGAVIASCSHDFDDLTVNDETVAKYNQMFIKTFGEPSPDQTWGFEDVAQSASRRVVTRGENANANEWADVTNSTGYGGWLVPDPLTEGQKLRVKAYFQANPNLGHEDPHWQNFFVQQVYKGHTSVGANSTEVVTAADGSTYTSDNMNHLTVGQSEVHINNFNNGDCTEVDVLDNGANIATHTGETYHKDKIMLMVNIDDTSCWGYHETGSSNEPNPNGAVNHNDRWALVSAEVIDAWAAAHGNIGEAVVDKWNRSFIGFDLAIKEGDAIFSGETQQLTTGFNMGYDGIYYADDNYVLYDYDDSWNRIMPNGAADVMTDAKGNALKLLDSNMNFYSGDVVELDDPDLRKDFYIEGVGNKVMLNMERPAQLIAQGYYPVSGSAFKTWVKPTPSYDLYYSDWIVTVTKAERVTTDTPDDPDDPDESVDTWDEWARIICEDLSVNEATDFDFNDVVFDVRLNTARTKAQIKLLAAGGTLPLTVGWTGQAGTSYADYEVHNDFGVGVNVMVNTNWKNGATKSPVEKTLTGTFNTYNDVKIMVQKNGTWHEITAHKGQPASKILVKPTYVWCDERIDISYKYNGRKYAKSFSDYVKDPSVASDWYE